MIFLTVGTQFPFDRLVKAVDDAFDKGLIEEEVFAQIGETRYKPHNFESAVSMEKKAYDEYMERASAVIGHAGMGTIRMALDHDKPLIVMPRLKRYREVVNDHQLAIVRKFEELGYLLAAYQEEDFPKKVRQLKDFVPKKRETQVEAVVGRVARYLSALCGSKS